jgi:hypothetical protein
MTIEKIANGYLLHFESYKEPEAYPTLEEAFRRAMLHLEGLSESFGGDRWAKLTIERGIGKS